MNGFGNPFKDLPPGGRLLGNAVPEAPPVTETVISLQSNNLFLVRLQNESGELAGYQMRFVDPYFHRTIIFPMSVKNATDFHSDFADLLAGKMDEVPNEQR